LVGNFSFRVFIKNQLVAADDEIKIAAYLFLILKSNTPGTFVRRSKMIQCTFHWRGNLFMRCFQENS